MMFGSGRRRIKWSPPWQAAAIVAAVIVFAGLLVVNIAGQGYERQPFLSSNYASIPSSGFPATFLRSSLNDKPSCEPVSIKEGDGMLPRNFLPFR
jgi:hypothetical protein